MKQSTIEKIVSKEGKMCEGIQIKNKDSEVVYQQCISSVRTPR
jgi:hypothetical protein